MDEPPVLAWKVFEKEIKNRKIKWGVKPGLYIK